MTEGDEIPVPRAPKPIERRVERLVTPLQEFASDQIVASALLLVCAVAALVLANSSWAEGYAAILHTEAGVQVGGWDLTMSLHHWVNDGLMALFFFLLGLEIKREMLAGDLQDPRRVRLLVLTAVGGMVVPAAVFLVLCPPNASDGWGVPMATDTAFAIGVLALLRSRVPTSLAAFLVGLAIVDDIGAVLVIALFYSHGFDLGALGAALLLFGGLVSLNVLGVRRPAAYLVLGAALWYAVLCSGIHATVAGVLVAVTIPARTKVSPGSFDARIRRLLRRWRRQRDQEADILAAPDQQHLVQEVQRTARRASTPLQRWEMALETPISLLVLPLFALANAGVTVEAASFPSVLGDSMVVAAAGGLVFGKLLGIAGFCWLGLRFRVGALPEEVTMRHVAGMSLLAGMGFTMSIFVANLAFAGDGATLQLAKLGILVGTAVAGLAGYLLLRLTAGGERRAG